MNRHIALIVMVACTCLLSAWAPSLCKAQSTTAQPADQSPAAGTKTEPQDADTNDDSGAESEESLSDRIKHFLRLRRDRDGRPVAMETSVTRYIGQNSQGETVTVDLIGVVHIGEKDYYEQLNQAFTKYDAMLYELVAPEGTVVPKGGRRDGGDLANPVAALQMGMQSVLGLEFQLDHIDYTKDNFVHADMSPDEFAASMRRNDESFTKMFLRAIGQSMASSSSGRDTEIMLAMMSGKFKRRQVMAAQMQDMESGMIIFQGREGSTIIEHRNAKALDILKREIAAGNKHLALFYGAGHLPDMERRLLSEFQMKRAGQYWLTAWRLAPTKPAQQPDDDRLP